MRHTLAAFCLLSSGAHAQPCTILDIDNLSDWLFEAETITRSFSLLEVGNRWLLDRYFSSDMSWPTALLDQLWTTDGSFGFSPDVLGGLFYNGFLSGIGGFVGLGGLPGGSGLPFMSGSGLPFPSGGGPPFKPNTVEATSKSQPASPTPNDGTQLDDDSLSPFERLFR